MTPAGSVLQQILYSKNKVEHPAVLGFRGQLLSLVV